MTLQAAHNPGYVERREALDAEVLRQLELRGVPMVVKLIADRVRETRGFGTTTTGRVRLAVLRLERGRKVKHHGKGKGYSAVSP